jgi:cardiolipin synthase C
MTAKNARNARWTARAPGFLAIALLAAGSGACARLPQVSRPPATYVEDTSETTLARRFDPLLAARSGLSGVLPLTEGRDAFGMRLALASVAERTLDAQYFIWHDDLAGTLLFDALRAAGERGVRVRLLLDDANTRGLDPLLVALDAYPNVEVRVFNAFARRAARFLGYASDFGRLNRRMHNKSFTADNRATIVGGRNVGDEYFGSHAGRLFDDLDLFAAGPVVDAVSAQFDRYWNSPAAYPVEGLAGRTAPLSQSLPALAATLRQEVDAREYLASIDKARLARVLDGEASQLDWVPARLTADDPSKVSRDDADGLRRIIDDFSAAIGPIKTSLDIISPYFVPGANGARWLAELAGRGVRVRVLTNSLHATNHAVVHAGYLKRRRTLLRAGVRLFEMKAERPEDSSLQRGFASSSGAVLHAKTFAVDGHWVFVGSFNFDPRSVSLNTEMGLLLDDALIAQRIDQAFETRIPHAAWEVQLRPDGALQWLDRALPTPAVLTREPNTGFFERIGVRALSLLPLDWML